MKEGDVGFVMLSKTLQSFFFQKQASSLWAGHPWMRHRAFTSNVIKTERLSASQIKRFCAELVVCTNGCER